MLEDIAGWLRVVASGVVRIMTMSKTRDLRRGGLFREVVAGEFKRTKRRKRYKIS